MSGWRPVRDSPLLQALVGLPRHQIGTGSFLKPRAQVRFLPGALSRGSGLARRFPLDQAAHVPQPPYGQPHLVDRPRGPTAGISEVRADRYLGHAGTTVSDRYRHRLRGQLESDAALLDDYFVGRPRRSSRYASLAAVVPRGIVERKGPRFLTAHASGSEGALMRCRARRPFRMAADAAPRKRAR
jgi:hypothetical protein